MSSGSAEANQGAVFSTQPSADRTAGETADKTAPGSLLGSLIEATTDESPREAPRLERFLQEESLVEALQLWFGAHLPRRSDEIARLLNRAVAFLDDSINQQINAILHHPKLQRLEASWRGLRSLVEQVDREGDSNVVIRVLGASWKELERDFERSIEFDQSQLFRKVYDEEFGTPGGEPYSLLIGDYEIHPRPGPGHPHDDVGILRSISQVAAAAFCPFITASDPSMFGLNNFGTLEQRLNHAATFEQIDYLRWRSFRDSEDARFVGITLPHILMRTPYTDDGSRIDGFQFKEDVSGPDRSKYLWGNAAYAFGAVAIRAYAETGWLADIRGVQRGVEGGGLVTSLPVQSFGTDRQGIAVKSSTDVVITDELEKELSDLGFLPLCDCKDTEYSAFYSNPTAQKPKKYDRLAATTNARMSAMLQYMLCVSRFAHYVKVLSRDKIGTFGEPAELEQFLQTWVMQYVTSDTEAEAKVKARFPLREANVQVRPQPGKPGAYQCVMHFAPHYELDEMTAAVRIATELAPPRIP